MLVDYEKVRISNERYNQACESIKYYKEYNRTELNRYDVASARTVLVRGDKRRDRRIPKRLKN
jgi:hypothetical protein